MPSEYSAPQLSLELPIELAFEALVRGSFQEKWDVAKTIPRFGGEAIAPLGKLLHYPDPEVRWFAARILGDLDHPQALELLVELLATSTEEIRTIAFKSLAGSGIKAIPALVEKLTLPETRLFAVQALSQIDSEEIIYPLLGVVADENPVVRTMAIAALQNHEVAEVIPVLVKSLGDEAPSVRREAVVGLGLWATRSHSSLDLAELVSLLAPRLADSHLEVAQQAAIALRRVNTAAAVTALGEFLLNNPSRNSAINSQVNFQFNSETNSQINLYLEILQQLGWIDHPSILDYFQWGLDHGSPQLWLEIVTILGRVEICKPRACSLLGQMLTSNHPATARAEIRQAMAVSLGQLREPAGQDALNQLLHDRDRSVQLHSQFALSLLSAEEGS
jgi:HEAT repeat protein